MKRLLPILMLFSGAAGAAGFPDLPPDAQVEAALRQHPLVRSALAGVAVEVANGERLAAGPHEFAVTLASQQRRERLSGQRFLEHEIGVERAIRLPGKAARDVELGAAGVEQARLAANEAMHEGARTLLALWFDWRREAAAQQQWEMQCESLRRQLDVVGKRVALGDAAELEKLAAGAQLAQAEAQLANVRGRRERAAIELAQAYPGIVLPDAASLAGADPLPPDPAFASWREQLLAHNHELAVARAAYRRSQLSAQRLEAERTPDPTVGLRFGSERDGQERIVGVQLTIPLPGQGRAAGARAGQAEAAVAAAREAQVLARVEAEARRLLSLAQSSHAQWQRLADVARRMDENVRLLDRAWRLGEGRFDELQNARRLAVEARLGAAQARLDAIEAGYRLQLDAHRLWDFAPDPGDALASHP